MKKLIKKKLKELIIERMGVIPSIFSDEYYSSNIINDFKNRHDLVWSKRFNSYHGDVMFDECLFKFKTSEVYLYLKKRDDENSFSIKIYFEEKNMDSIRFLISSIKEHKTI